MENELESEYKLFTIDTFDELRRNAERKKQQKLKAAELNKKNQSDAATDTQGDETGPDPTLCDGEVLPQYYGKCPDRLLGRPIEDLDPYYKERGEETFCVATERFSSMYIYRFSASGSCFIFSPFNPIRRLAIRIAVNQFFDYFVMLTIVVNCVFLALDNEIVESEYVFTAIYTCEMLIKMLARGVFLSKFTYLRDGWNWLDFIVVMLAWVTILLTIISANIGLSGLSGLRTFRVIRAFKSFTIVPGLKTIVNALLQSLKPLAEVMVIMLFLVVVISLIALQAYQGVLRRKCVKFLPSADNLTAEEFNNYVQDSNNWNPVSGEKEVCGNASSSGLCPDGYVCMQDVGENPNHGLTNFDHFGWAMLTSFQLLTLDFWENVYNMIIRAEGAWNVLFFFMSVILGPFYLLNLLLAVVTLAYSKEHEKQTKLREMRERAKENARRRNKRRRLLMERAKQKLQSPASFGDVVEHQIGSSLRERAENGGLHVNTGNGDSGSEKKRNFVSGAIKKDNTEEQDSRSQIPIVIKGNSERDLSQNDNQLTREPSYSKLSDSKDTKRATFRNSSRKNISLESSESASSTVPEWKKWICKRYNSFHGACCSWSCHPRFVEFQNFLLKIVEHKLFEGIVVLSILTNTAFLAMDHHEIHPTFESVLIHGNYVFTGIFAIEAVLKIFAMSPLEYLRNPWNVFDFTIVLISLIEFMIPSSTGALSVLRSLRLMRVFRLARIWTTMRKLMSIILKSLSAVVYLTIVLFMVLFIFAVVGKQLFGHAYINSGDKFDDGQVPRWNFVDFYHSFLLVWRVMCGEWIEPLHDCMMLVDASCIPVFLLMTFIGNFLVLNLFTAILLEAFNVDNLKSKQVDQKTAKLKLGVERFRKLLKKSQSRKSVDVTAANDCKENENNQNKENGTHNPNEPKNNDETTGSTNTLNSGISSPKRSMSATDIFALHRATQKERALSLDESSEEDSESITIKKNPPPLKRSFSQDSPSPPNDHPFRPRPRRQGTLTKQSRISEDSPVTIKKSNFVPMTIQEVDENEPNSTEDNDAANNSVSKKVTFAVSGNSKVYPKRQGDAENGIEESDLAVQIKLPWYKKCCASLCGENEKENVKSVVAIEKTEDTPYENHMEHEQKKKTKPKNAPSCFPQWCNCCDRYGENCLFRKWKIFRNFIFRVVSHQIFEWFILFIILASTVCLAMEDVYLKEDKVKVQVLNILEYVFTTIFTIEMILKWIGIGWSKYFTNWWCIIDFVIVVISWIGIGASAVGEVESLKALRTLRALRPLRAISRWQGMRVVVNALVYCIPSIANVLCVCMLLWLVFSIIGVQQFKGRFYRCEDLEGNVLNHTIVPNRTICEQHTDYRWITPRINFDNVLNGMIALFQVATFEGWIEIMADASDTVNVDEQPYREANKYSYVFFFCFVLIGSFFILNLIVGVIIESFQKLRKQTESSSAVEAFLTESQKNFYKTMRTMLNRKPKKTIPPPENPTQQKIFKLVTHSKFEVAVFSVIVLNMITLAMEHYQMSKTWTTVLRYVDITFTAVFSIEATLKIIGTRFYYFRDPFNVFDFVVVILSITGFILEELLTFLVSPTLLRVVRVFRVFRVLRVIRAARGIRRLILTLMISLPALFNIAVLLGVFMIIFAILGMSFFMDVKLRGALNDIVNFRTFGNSMMLLFRLMTSAGWNDVLDPLMNDTDCDGADCGKYHFAIIYFVAYIFLVFLVVVNMYIAIILENFDEIFQQEESGVGQDDFEYFYVVWGRYDPKASQFVSIAELSNLLHSLHPPFQLAKPNEIKIAALNLPIVNGDKVHCLDVLFALVKRIMGEVEISDQMREEAEARLLKSFPNRKTLKAETTTLVLRRRVKAAKVIQEAWRGFHGRRRRGAIDVSSDIFSHVSSSDFTRSNSFSLSSDISASSQKQTLKTEISGISKLPSVDEIQQLHTENNNIKPNEALVEHHIYPTKDGDVAEIEIPQIPENENILNAPPDVEDASQTDIKKQLASSPIRMIKESESDSKLNEVNTSSTNGEVRSDQDADSTCHDNVVMNNGTIKMNEASGKVDDILNSPQPRKTSLERRAKSAQMDVRTNKTKLDQLRPSTSLQVIRNDHALEEKASTDDQDFSLDIQESDHILQTPLKKQTNMEKHENTQNSSVSLPKPDSLDSGSEKHFHSSETNAWHQTLQKSKSDVARLSEDSINIKDSSQESRPVVGKNLKFNPQTGKFKVKTKKDEVELVEMSRSPSTKINNNTNSITPGKTEVDQSLVITNNNVSESKFTNVTEENSSQA
uniref:sodium channel protein type 4 subunit alpha B-like n=1 Tax=Styela clava TaxID=7725 RepID=UPI001939C426|nr:sodium channel protein type 4 subunit alpha B-like [Styela clava]